LTRDRCKKIFDAIAGTGHFLDQARHFGVEWPFGHSSRQPAHCALAAAAAAQ